MNIFCCKYYRALPHIIILVKLQRGIKTAASSNKWPTNVVPYVLENAFFAIRNTATNKSMFGTVNWKLQHITILVKLQIGIMTAASSNKWPTNVVPYVLVENAFFAIWNTVTNKSMFSIVNWKPPHIIILVKLQRGIMTAAS